MGSAFAYGLSEKFPFISPPTPPCIPPWNEMLWLKWRARQGLLWQWIICATAVWAAKCEICSERIQKRAFPVQSISKWRLQTKPLRHRRSGELLTPNSLGKLCFPTIKFYVRTNLLASWKKENVNQGSKPRTINNVLKTNLPRLRVKNGWISFSFYFY